MVGFMLVPRDGDKVTLDCPSGLGTRCPTKCPLSAVCPVPGLTAETALVAPGWWRAPWKTSSVLGEVLVECPLKSACLGDNATALLQAAKSGVLRAAENNVSKQSAACAEGYMGVLCHNCAPGWGRDGPHGCVRCHSAPASNAIVALGGVAVIGTTAVLIALTIRGKGKPSSIKAGLGKIVLNHFQARARCAVRKLREILEK